MLLLIFIMLNIENTEIEKKAEKTQDQHLVLDGTVNLDYSDDDKIPRVKGLIELLSQFYSNKPNQNL